MNISQPKLRSEKFGDDDNNNNRHSVHIPTSLYISVPHPSHSHSLLHNYSFTHLPIPSSLWPTDGCPTPADVFRCTVGKSKCSCSVSETYFHDFGKSGTFDIPSWILRDTGTELFKTHKTGTNGIPNLTTPCNVDPISTACRLPSVHSQWSCDSQALLKAMMYETGSHLN